MKAPRPAFQRAFGFRTSPTRAARWVLPLSFLACEAGPTWTGYVREAIEDPDPKKGHILGEFHSLEACRAACLSLIRERECPGEGCWPNPDYECGVECQPNGYGLNLCARTER